MGVPRVSVTSRAAKWFGIASAVSGDVAELTRRREDAEAELGEILAAAPDLAADLRVEEVELVEVSTNQLAAKGTPLRQGVSKSRRDPGS